MRKIGLAIWFLCSTVIVGSVSHAQVMIGAYVPGDAWDVREIVAFNEASEKDLAFVTIFSAFSHDWENQLHWQSSNIYNNAAIPLITWMPVDTERKTTNLLPEIIAGDWDAYIDDWIAGLLTWVDSYASYKKPIVLLRFAHEFNGSWYPYSGEPSQYVAAWQHIHDRFAATRANDYVEWVWSANHINYDEHDDMTLYYPGERYVDWTSLDGYNWGTNHDWTEWDSFQDLFAAAYHTLVTNYPNKPILIAEYGTAEPADLPSEDWMQYGNNSDRRENKAAWFYDTLAVIEQRYPAIRGLGLFNLDKELSWSVTGGDSTGLDGYNLGMASNHYTSRFLGARLMILGAAIDDETLRRLEEEPVPVYDVVLDGSINRELDRADSNTTVVKAYYATDRLRTLTVRRDMIDLNEHQRLASENLPGEETMQLATETAKNYRERFKKRSRQQRGKMARGRMNMLDY